MSVPSVVPAVFGRCRNSTLSSFVSLRSSAAVIGNLHTHPGHRRCQRASESSFTFSYPPGVHRRVMAPSRGHGRGLRLGFLPCGITQDIVCRCRFLRPPRLLPARIEEFAKTLRLLAPGIGL